MAVPEMGLFEEWLRPDHLVVVVGHRDSVEAEDVGRERRLVR